MFLGGGRVKQKLGGHLIFLKLFRIFFCFKNFILWWGSFFFGKKNGEGPKKCGWGVQQIHLHNLPLPSSATSTSLFSTFPHPSMSPSPRKPPWPRLLHLDLVRGFIVVTEKVADLEIYLFSATKQDSVGPSLQSRNNVFTFCSLLYLLYTWTGFVD